MRENSIRRSRIFIGLSLILGACALLNCFGFRASADGSVRMLYYMIGSDLESRKDAASDDLMEILRAPGNGNTEVYVLAGGALSWKLDPEMNGRNTLLHLKDGSFEKLPFPAGRSMGAGETLAAFLKACAPGDGSWHLIFWGHGAGGEGIGRDENHEDAYLSLEEISAALRGQENPPCIVGMDACGMFREEVSSALKDCCSFFIGTTGEEPTEGWPHHLYLAEMTGDGQADAEKIRDAANLRQKRRNEPETTFLIRTDRDKD